MELLLFKEANKVLAGPTFTHSKVQYTGNLWMSTRRALSYPIGKEDIKNQEIKGNILIVDDDPNITSLFKLLLKCMNYDKGYTLNVDTTHSGIRAQELANKKIYNLIFITYLYSFLRQSL